MKTFLLASGAGLLALMAAGPAAAQSAPSVRIDRVTVERGDLDLTTQAGAGTMLNRLNRAASQACGGKPSPALMDPVGPPKRHAYRLCKVAAIDAATRALDVPLVRTSWLESGDAILFGDEARRTTAELLAQAGLGAPDRLAINDRFAAAGGGRAANSGN